MLAKRNRFKNLLRYKPMLSGPVAQPGMGKNPQYGRPLGMRKVAGSNPARSTKTQLATFLCLLSFLILRMAQ